MGFETSSIERNWQELKDWKFENKDLKFKPYNLMDFKLKQPLDEHMVNLVEEENIFRKIHLDHMLTLNFAHPIPDPASALLMKV